jgi:hypothetical protein
MGSPFGLVFITIMVQVLIPHRKAAEIIDNSPLTPLKPQTRHKLRQSIDSDDLLDFKLLVQLLSSFFNFSMALELPLKPVIFAIFFLTI